MTEQSTFLNQAPAEPPVLPDDESTEGPTLGWVRPPSTPRTEGVGDPVVVEMGWGKLIFAHTFESADELVETICDEGPRRRHVAFYVRDPHVLVSLAPHRLFLDPSHTFRLRQANYSPDPELPKRYGLRVRRATSEEDAAAINRIYESRRMVQAKPEFVTALEDDAAVRFVVAEDLATGEIVGSAAGVDHVRAFGDPEQGTSIWSVAADPQYSGRGVGRTLVQHLVEHYRRLGRAYVDLSVMHDNERAIQIYQSIGFERVAVFCVKHKNAINEPLFVPSPPEARLNPYARIIIDEARHRGIRVEVLDEEANYFALTLGGRRIVCRESLSELTSAIAMSRCDDKRVTLRLLKEAGLSVPAQQLAGPAEQNLAFLKQHKRLVVKPARGEQGRGISVDLRTADELDQAIARAREECQDVVLEQFCDGMDLRVIVIGFKVVAAAVRKPAEVVGDGRSTVAELIERQSRRRMAVTGGESRIPMDAETERCVRAAGVAMDTVLPDGQVLRVRKTANLHTGGTIHDVTAQLHPTLVEAAERAARAIDIPVTGLDFLAPKVDGADYVIIEANERPGLANHEPQPTAKRFVDLLFPQTEGNA